MNSPEPSNFSQTGDTVARIVFSYKDEALKSIDTPSTAQLTYKVRPSEQEVIDFYFQEFRDKGGDTSILDIEVTFTEVKDKIKYHSGTAQP